MGLKLDSLSKPPPNSVPDSLEQLNCWQGELAGFWVNEMQEESQTSAQEGWLQKGDWDPRQAHAEDLDEQELQQARTFGHTSEFLFPPV